MNKPTIKPPQDSTIAHPIAPTAKAMIIQTIHPQLVLSLLLEEDDVDDPTECE